MTFDTQLVDKVLPGESTLSLFKNKMTRLAREAWPDADLVVDCCISGARVKADQPEVIMAILDYCVFAKDGSTMYASNDTHIAFKRAECSAVPVDQLRELAFARTKSAAELLVADLEAKGKVFRAEVGCVE